MKKRYIGLMILSVLIMMTGMGLYTYQVTSGNFGLILISYPYQTQGLILLIAGAGMSFVGLGFCIRNWKAESMVIKQSS